MFNYFFYLECLKIFPSLDTFQSYFIDKLSNRAPKKFLQENRLFANDIKGQNAALLKYCKQYFNVFKKYDLPSDPFFLFIAKGFNCYKNGAQQLYQLCDGLRQDLGSAIQTLPPGFKFTYVKTYLMPRKQFKDAISLLKSVLFDEKEPNISNDIFKTAMHYNLLSTCMILNMQYEESLQVIEKSKNLEYHPANEWNEVMAKLMLEQYDDPHILQTLKKLMNLSPDDRKRYALNHKDQGLPYAQLKRVYEYALLRSNRTEELNDFISSIQQKTLEKVRNSENKRAENIKMQMEEKQRAQQRNAVPLSKKKTATKTTHTPISTSLVEESSVWDSPTSNNRDRSPGYDYVPKKEKLKKKGIADPEKASPQPVCTQSEIKSINLVFIEDLTKNKNTINTFKRLFAKFEAQFRSDSNVTISYNEFTAFCKSLRIDLSPGKGSHKKVTLNFQNLGINMEEEMITLSNTKKLIPDQIRDLREAFINAGFLYKDSALIERLRKDGYNLIGDI